MGGQSCKQYKKSHDNHVVFVPSCHFGCQNLHGMSFSHLAATAACVPTPVCLLAAIWHVAMHAFPLASHVLLHHNVMIVMHDTGC